MNRRGRTLRRFPYVAWPTSWVGVPLRAKERTIGLIAAFVKPEHVTEAGVRILELIARQAAIALENARLLERERTRAERLAILNDISRTISAVLDLEPLLQAIARECMRLARSALPADRLPRRQRGLDHRHGAGRDHRPSRRRDRASARSPPSSCGRGRRSSCRITRRRAARTAVTPAALPDLPLPMGWIGVPMVVGGHVVGVLAGFHPGGARDRRERPTALDHGEPGGNRYRERAPLPRCAGTGRRRGAQPPRPRDPRHDRAGADRDDLSTRTGGHLPRDGAAETGPRARRNCSARSN